MTSQFLAIFYLNDLDHYIKEKLKMKYYIRYMDDLLILDTDKEKLKSVCKIISNELIIFIHEGGHFIAAKKSGV